MLTQIKNFIIPDKNDPDEIRRQRLINILSIGILVSAISALIFIFIFLITNPEKWQKQDNQLLVFITVICVLGGLGLYYLNKFSSRLASLLLLLFLTLVSAFSDTPEQLSNGRSLFLFVIPISISSLLLSPISSFVFAVINSVIITYLAELAQITPNIAAIIIFFFIALISWLSSRSLEQALKDLRTINAELDQRVVERTQELSAALARETIEAGRREAILNSIADGVVVFDRNGTAILANPSISSLINKPQEKIIGNGLSTLLDSEELKPDEREKIASHLEKSAKDFSNFRVEWGKKTLSVNAAEVTDDQKQSIGIVAVLRDFTREAELEKMKNTFMAIVSHELRTPLNAILGYAEMLKESVYGPLNEKQQSVSVRIMTNTQRLLTIVSDLLDQAQIEAGKLKVQTVPCRPVDLIDNLHSVMDKIAFDKGLNLVTELDPSMPSTIFGDSQRLQQIMVNLVNNAVKFTEKGGIYVKVFTFDENKWQIQVTDTGRGIPDDAKEYIFESFRQVEGASTRQHGGVGLGLSIVKQLVELMKGSIGIESETGKGSTFTVTLPLILNKGTPTQPV